MSWLSKGLHRARSSVHSAYLAYHLSKFVHYRKTFFDSSSFWKLIHLQRWNYQQQLASSQHHETSEEYHSCSSQVQIDKWNSRLLRFVQISWVIVWLPLVMNYHHTVDFHHCRLYSVDLLMETDLIMNMIVVKQVDVRSLDYNLSLIFLVEETPCGFKENSCFLGCFWSTFELLVPNCARFWNVSTRLGRSGCSCIRKE